MRGRAYFNGKAHEWDTYMPAEEVERVGTILRTLPLAPGGAVLDVGCGTGVIVPFLRERVGEQGRVVAIDYAERMVMRARAKLPSEPAFIAADIHAAPLVDSLFDAVVCFNCFPHFQDKPQAFAEMTRVLKPAGVLIVCHSQSREGINALHNEVGGVVKQDRIPEEQVMRELFAGARLRDTTIENGARSYVAVGWKTGELCG